MEPVNVLNLFIYVQFMSYHENYITSILIISKTTVKKFNRIQVPSWIDIQPGVELDNKLT